MKLILAVAACGLMAQAALADNAPTANAPKGKGPCSEIKLTDAEKAQIKTARESFKTQTAPLFAAAKTARQSYYKMAVDPKSDSALALTSSQAVSDASAKVAAARQQLKTEILFNVLTQEQRAPFLKCEMLRKKWRRGHHGQGHQGQGQAHGQRPTQEKQS